MIPNISGPTDNIYKFIALFGLALLISSILALVYTYDKYFDRGYSDLLELEVLKARTVLSSDDNIKMVTLQNKLNTDQDNKETFKNYLMSCIGGSISIALLGCYFWLRKVQPKQDKLLDLQIEKMKREIQVIEKQLEKKDEEKLSRS
jgi:hypothetical protein